MPAPQFRRGSFATATPETHTPATHPNTNAPGVGVRTNKYGSKCVNCGVFVPEQQGMIEKRGEKWVVMHIEPCPEPGTEDTRIAAAAAAEPKHVQTVVKGEPLFDGTYTYETRTAYRTFRLRTQALDDDFMPGRQIIEYLTGRDNEADYTSFGVVRPDGSLQVWKKHQDKETLVRDAKAFLADPHGPAVLASVACYRCGRTLTVPASVHNGLGPECAKRGL
jgi:hypothetical protein